MTLDDQIAALVRDAVREELAGILPELRELVTRAQRPVPTVASIADASAITGLSQRTITRRVATGELRTVKIGSRTLIPVDQLTELVTPTPV